LIDYVSSKKCFIHFVLIVNWKSNNYLIISCTILINLFICIEKDPEIKPLEEEDSEVLQRMMLEIPLWIKNPDFDRVRT
jgi:hypothetical protein